MQIFGKNVKLRWVRVFLEQEKDQNHFFDWSRISGWMNRVCGSSSPLPPLFRVAVCRRKNESCCLITPADHGALLILKAPNRRWEQGFQPFSCSFWGGVGVDGRRVTKAAYWHTSKATALSPFKASNGSEIFHFFHVAKQKRGILVVTFLKIFVASVSDDNLRPSKITPLLWV